MDPRTVRVGRADLPARWRDRFAARTVLARGPRKDFGAATLEFTGMVAVAALVAVSVLLAAVPNAPFVGSKFREAVCQIISLGQGDCGGVTSPEAHRPTEPCVIHSDSTTSEGEVAVIFVTAKNGRTYEVAKLSDGRYRITYLSDGAVGVETGVGGGLTVTVNDRNYGGSATADVSAALDFQSGDVWYASSEQEAYDILVSAAESDLKDQVVGSGGPLRSIVDWGEDQLGIGAGNPPEPDETFAQGGLVLNASAEATDIAVSAGAEVGATEALGVRTTKDGRTTVYLSTTVQGEAGLQSVGIDPNTLDPQFIGAQANGKLQLVTAVTFDSSGNMVEVSTTATAAGESKGLVTALFGGSADPSLTNSVSTATVYRATLPIKTDADKMLAEQYLMATGVMQLGGPIAMTLTAAPAAYATTEFLTAARNRGQLTQQSFDTNNTTVVGVEAEGKLGVELGVDYKLKTGELTSTGGQYWDGVNWQTWQGCTG